MKPNIEFSLQVLDTFERTYKFKNSHQSIDERFKRISQEIESIFSGSLEKYSQKDLLNEDFCRYLVSELIQNFGILRIQIILLLTHHPRVLPLSRKVSRAVLDSAKEVIQTLDNEGMVTQEGENYAVNDMQTANLQHNVAQVIAPTLEVRDIVIPAYNRFIELWFQGTFFDYVPKGTTLN